MEKKIEVKKLSASLIAKFLKCPLKFKFSEIDGMSVEPTMPQHLIYGGAVHKAVEELHKGIFHGNRLPLKQMLDIFTDAWNWEIEYLENPIAWTSRSQEEEMRKAAFASLGEYFKIHADDPPPPAFINEDGKLVPAVEAKFLLPLDGLCANRGWALSGVIDLIERKDELNIIDHKTSSAKYSEFEIKTNVQLPLYSWAFRTLVDRHRFPDFAPGTQEDHVVFDVLLKKRPAIVPQKRKIGDTTFRHIGRIIDSIINQIERKEFIPNYGSECKAFGGCEFASFCADFKF